MLALLAAALPACAGDGERQESGSAPRAAAYFKGSGPIGAPVLGRLERDTARPTTAFATTETEAVAFVSIRRDVPEGSRLVVEWYRLRGSDRRRLFVHELRVQGRGRARSAAVAHGGLPVGLYETVATLGGHRTRTLWVVTRRPRQTRALAGVRSSAAAASGIEAGSATFDEFDWDSPSAPAAEPDDGSCRPSTGVRAIVELSVHAGWSDACTRLTVAASVTGPPETLRTIVAAEQVNDAGVRQHSVSITTDMCDIPGGSDLPGTVVRAVVTDSSGAVARAEQVLPDLGPALQTGLDANPASGSRVRPGDRIALHALALLMSPAHGVKTLYVNVGDELFEATGNLARSSRPVACDPRRLLAQLRTEYRVPPSPPTVIEICANATGFDGTAAEPDCAQFFTGEVWEGTIVHDVTAVPASGGQCGSRARLNGTVRLVVADDGSVTGTYDIAGPCVTQPHGEFTGRATEDAFHFPQLIVQTNGEPVQKVSETRAHATLTNFQGAGGVGARWVTTWDLRCTSC